MAKLARSWPPSRMRSTSSREMSASVRPAKGRSFMATATASTTRAAARRASTSAASFWARSGPVTAGGGDEAGRRAGPPGGRARTWPRCGRRWRPGAGAAGQAGDDGHRVLRLAPRPDGEGLGPLLDPGGLERRHHQRGVAGPGQHQHGEPFQRHGGVAGEVRQVGADRQQQHVDGQLLHPAAGPGDPLLEHHPKATGRCTKCWFRTRPGRVLGPTSPRLLLLSQRRPREREQASAGACSLSSRSGTANRRLGHDLDRAGHVLVDAADVL